MRHLITIKLYRDRASADGRPCPYCRRRMSLAATQRSGLLPSRDHIRPKDKGATLDNNKIICCQRCNGDKSNRTLWEWHHHLAEKKDPRAVHVVEVIIRLYPYLGHAAYAESVGSPSDEAWYP